MFRCLDPPKHTRSTTARVLGMAFGVLVFVAVAVWPPWPTDATPACAQRTVVLEYFKKKYREEPVALGLANDGRVLEVLTTRTGSTWTIIMTLPDGRSCVVAAGESWDTVRAMIKGRST